MRAYPSVTDVPGEVDLAVIAVPAEAVADAAGACAEKGVPAIVVISAGFAEVGEEGAERQQRAARDLPRGGHAADRPELPRDPQHRRRGQLQRHLRAVDAAAWQRRLRDPERRPRPGADRPRRGSRASASRRSPRSAIAPTSRPTTCSSTGRRTRAPGSRSSTSSRSAIRAASPGWRGGSGAGSRSSSSRAVARRPARERPSPTPGRCSSASDVTVDALFDQVGVIRTDSLAELLDVASLLANQPLPAGRRVGIITNAGGPGDHVRRRLRGGRPRGADAARTRCEPRWRRGSRPRRRSPTRST